MKKGRIRSQGPGDGSPAGVLPAGAALAAAASAGQRLLAWGPRLLALLLMPMAAPVCAAMPCPPLKAERDQLASQAINAEIALLHSIRLKLCPREEALAGQANALAAAGSASEPFDYERYIRCRRAAEARIERSRAVLYRNRRGFTYYTVEGARWARQADALQQLWEQQCPQAAP